MLAGIIALAGLLRFYDLTSRGLIYWDEAKFALEGLRFRALLESLVGLHVSLLAGKTVGTAKPTHGLFIAFAYLLLGAHDYAPLLMNASFSLAAVALTFFLGKRLFSPGVGLIAGLLLATSEYETIYARSALSESDAAAILVLAVLVYTWPGNANQWRPIFLTGIVLGLAFTTNYRILIYGFALVLFDLLWTWRSKGILPAAPRLAAWIAGALVFPLAWQVVDLLLRAHGIVLFRDELTGAPTLYYQEVIYQLHQGKQAVLHFDPRLYIQWFVVRQSWLSFALLLGGLAMAFVQKSRWYLLISSLIVVPWVIYVFAPFVVPRNLEAALPFIVILQGAALMSASRMIVGWRQTQRVGAVVALALTLSGLDAAMTWRLTAERSGFAAAAAYIKRHDDGRALTSNEVMVFYLRGQGAHCRAPAMPLKRRALEAEVQIGYRYAVIDHHTSHFSDWVIHHAPKIALWPVAGHISLGEYPVDSENSYAPGDGHPREHVRIYDLRPLHLPSTKRLPRTCNRNRVT
ncbi:MAG: glycosyltransferase family 39 protein [Chloroflexota bacterium]